MLNASDWLWMQNEAAKVRSDRSQDVELRRESLADLQAHTGLTTLVTDGAYVSPEIVPASNLNGSGPRPVSASHSMNRFGIHDLAGNVREWCLNESTRGGQRFILGGGWNDHN